MTNSASFGQIKVSHNTDIHTAILRGFETTAGNCTYIAVCQSAQYMFPSLCTRY